jgi:hypothetical protein
MLTRHFYKEDEVNAALMWACSTGRIREGLFWTQELIDSNNAMEALRILIHAWILFVGVRKMSWIQQASKLCSAETFEEDDLILLAYQLLNFPVENHDNTCLSLLYLGTQNPTEIPDRLNEKGWIDPKDISLRASVHRCVAQGKCELLWYLLRTEWNDSCWTMLSEACSQQEKKEYFTILQNIETFLQDPTKTWFFRALAVSFACCPSALFRESSKVLPMTMRDFVQKDRAHWESILGRKERREYSIPKDCLYWVTERGNLTYYDSTTDEIPDLLLYLSGNEYWNEALGHKTFDDLTEEEKVDFLELYMPDGHPMTWDKKEIEKSHGAGSLRLNEAPSHIKWLRTWYRSLESCLIWRGWEKAFQVASTLEDLELNSFYLDHQMIWKETVQQWNTCPVKKQLVLKEVEKESTLVFENYPVEPEVESDGEDEEDD